jgi:hypothetical protein
MDPDPADKLRAEDRSYDEQFLVDLALNLWNQEAMPSTKEIVHTLDDNKSARVLQATGMARRWQGSSSPAASAA